MNRFSMIALSAVLAVSSPVLCPVFAQDATYAEALVIDGQAAPYTDALGDSWTYDRLSDAIPGADGGWVAEVTLKRDASPGDIRTAIIGQLPGQLHGRVDVYVVADASLYQQVFSPTLVGQDLTYVLRETEPGTGLIVSDTIIQGGVALLRRGDIVSGSNGWTWSSFSEVVATRSGRVFVLGQAFEPTSQRNWFMIAEITAGEVLVNGHDFFPGVTRRLNWHRLAVSPSGLHWALAATTRITQEDMLIRDGAIESFAPGFQAYEGEPVPRAVSGDTQSTWRTFEGVAINDRGDLCFEASWWTPGVSLPVRGWVRNGKTISGVDGWVTLDGRGALVQLGDLFNGGAVKIDDKRIMPGSFLRVDTDRDGVVEPSVIVGYFQSISALTADGEVVAEARIRNSMPVESHDAFIRVRDYRIDTWVCEGAPNSAGSGARLHTSGSRFPGDDEVRVDFLELPPDAAGYLLFSRMSGSGVIPPGSQGELCLTGAIGRLNSQVFTATADGTARVGLDLHAIPQPNGPVRVMAGETWYTQGWYRDAIGGTPTSNFTMAVSIEFR